MNSVYLLLFVGVPAALLFAWWVEYRSQKRAARAFTNKLRKEEILATEQLLNELREKKFSKKKEFDEALDEHNKQYRSSERPSTPKPGDGDGSAPNE